MSGPEWWYRKGSLYEYSRRLTYPPTLRRVAPVEWEDHSEFYRRMVEFVPSILERWGDCRGCLRGMAEYWRLHGPSRLSFGSLRCFLLFHGHWRNGSGLDLLARSRKMLRCLSRGYSLAEAGSFSGFRPMTVSSWLYLLGFRKREKRDIYKSILADGGILTFRELLKRLRVGGGTAQELGREFGLRELFRGRRRELMVRLDGDNEVDGLPCWLLRHPSAVSVMLSLVDSPKSLADIGVLVGSSARLYSRNSSLLKRMMSYGWLSRYRGDGGRYYYMLTLSGQGLLARVVELLRGAG